MEDKQKEYLKAAASAVDAQASENVNFGIPVDPEVAEFMGAFEEDAISLEDIEGEEDSDE